MKPSKILVFALIGVALVSCKKDELLTDHDKGTLAKGQGAVLNSFASRGEVQEAIAHQVGSFEMLENTWIMGPMRI